MKGLFSYIICAFAMLVKGIEEDRMIITTIDDTNRYYHFEVYIGSTNVEKSLRINQEKEELSFYYMLYSPYLSKTVQCIDPNYKNEVYEDTLFLLNQRSNVSIPSFPFKIDNDYRSPLNHEYRGGIGFAYKFTNDSYSIIHQLKALGAISHLSYSLIPKNDHSKPGHIAFGGMPSQFTQGRTKGTCKVDQTQSKWSCELSKVIIGAEAIYVNHHRSHFQAAEQNILAPVEFIDQLIETIFRKPILYHLCFVTQIKVVYCEAQMASSIPSISFAFDKTVYTLNSSDLFSYSDDYLRFGISANQADGNAWKFGTRFLIHFPCLFDYENSVVEFYSDTKIRDEDLFEVGITVKLMSSKNTYCINCLGINCVVLVTGAISLLYIKYKKRDFN